MPVAEESKAFAPVAVPCWLRPLQQLEPVLANDGSDESSRVLAILTTLAPGRLLLAAAPAPRGLDAPEVGRDTLSERFPRRVALPQ